MSASGGCDTAVSARTRRGWVRVRKYVELLYGKRFHQKLIGGDYKSCVGPAILYGREAC